MWAACRFVLFLGVSMSITAFPVLARILEERGMQTTPLGATALMCAAVDDVCAWTLLAVALTLLPHSSETMSLPVRLLLLVAYVLFVLYVLRPLGRMIAKRYRREELSYEALAIVVVLVLLSAAATDALGVHPLFGAFLAGLAFPRIPKWQASVRARLEMLVSVLLLPFFFALTGMRSRFDLLTGWNVWGWTLVILVIAVVGKMGGATMAGAVGWRVVEGRVGAGCAAEYSRPGGVDRAEHRVQRAHLFADAVHYDGPPWRW